PAIVDAEVHATSASTATAADPPAPDPGGASTPISAELEAHLELGALVGGRRSITTPTPGRYASLLRASQRRFITMEHTVAESIDGGASIELHPDGRVEAC